MTPTLFAVLALAPAGKDVGPPRAYVQSGCDGVFYARCVPGKTDPAAGTTTIYRVEADRDVPVDVYPWYTEHRPALAWTPLGGGGVAVMLVCGGRAAGGEVDAVLSFHLNGRRLAAYSAADLERRFGVPPPRVVDSTGKPRPQFRAVGERFLGNNEYDFEIEADGKRFRFDIRTGKTRGEK